jgi:MoaA/NifB/PqqE/SkfB family radical SAM enzyme
MRVLQLEVSPVTAAKLAGRALAQRLGSRRPLFASFFVTARCNLRCTGCCYYDQIRDAGGEPDAPTERCVRILQGLAREGVPVVVLAGGEPALRPDLPQLIAAGRAAGLGVGIITNAMHITPEALAAADADAEWVLFSPHVPEELAGPAPQAAWEQAWQGFATMRQRLRRPFLGCAITLSRLTIPRLEELIARAVEGGADGVKFQPVFVPALFPKPEQTALAGRVIARWRRALPRRVLAPAGFIDRLHRFFGPTPSVPCTVDRHFHVGVYPDGTVSACCPQRIPLGNLLDGSLDFGQRRRARTDCYGCQRLDILTSLRVCGGSTG